MSSRSCTPQKSATGIATQLSHPPARQVAMQAVGRERYVERESVLCAQHLDLIDFLRGCDDAFGKRKSAGEIFEIIRRRHHHAVRKSVVAKGDRLLFRDADDHFAGAVSAKWDRRQRRGNGSSHRLGQWTVHCAGQSYLEGKPRARHLFPTRSQGSAFGPEKNYAVLRRSGLFLGAHSAKTDAPGRNDEKQWRPSENRPPRPARGCRSGLLQSVRLA